MANDFAKFITVFFWLAISLFMVALPGIIIVLIWRALRCTGVGALWILLIIIAILLLLTIPIFSYWRDASRYFSGFC